MKTSKCIIIVGGVAGGASSAARCRRLDENATIIVIDRGPYVSFANCGLPYYVGDVIKDERKLLVANAALFRERFNIEVRTQNEVTAIDRTGREIEVKELETGRVYREPYSRVDRGKKREARHHHRRGFYRTGDGGEPRPSRTRSNDR